MGNCYNIICPPWDCMRPAIVATDKTEDTLTVEFYPNRLYNTVAVLLSGCIGCCCLMCASSVDTYVFNKKTATCQVTKRYMCSTVREEYKDVLFGDVVRQQTYDGAKYFMVCVTKDQAHFLADSTGDLKRGIDAIREDIQKFFGFERYVRGKDRQSKEKKGTSKKDRLSAAVDGKVKTGGDDDSDVELEAAKEVEAAANSGKGAERIQVKTLYPKLKDRSDGHVFRRYLIYKPADYKKSSVAQQADRKSAVAAGPAAQSMEGGVSTAQVAVIIQPAAATAQPQAGAPAAAAPTPAPLAAPAEGQPQPIQEQPAASPPVTPAVAAPAPESASAPLLAPVSQPPTQ